MNRRPTLPFLSRYTLAFLAGVILSFTYEFPGLVAWFVLLIVWQYSAIAGFYVAVLLTGWIHGSLHIDRMPLPNESDLVIETAVDGPSKTYHGRIKFYRISERWVPVNQSIYFSISDSLPRGRLKIFTKGVKLYVKNSFRFARLQNTHLLSSDTSRLAAIRWYLHKRLQAFAPPKIQGVCFAMLFGTKRYLSQERYTLFKETGGSHVLAVSGLHVGLIYGILLFLMRPLGNRRGVRILRQIALVFTLWCFAAITGFSPSVVRAVGFFTIYVLAGWRNSISGITHALMLLLLVVGWIDPTLLRSAGLQLSYAAVLGIALFQPFIEKWIQDLPVVFRTICRACGVSFSAQICTFPLVIYYFGGMSSLGVVTSLLYIPYTFLIIILSILLLVGGGALGWLHFPMNWLDHSVMASMKALSNWRWAYIEYSFTIQEVVIAYAGILLMYFALRWRSKYAWFIFLIFLSLLLFRI